MPGKELRVVPHNTEAEESVLGSLLIDKNAIVKIADWIEPEDFYHHNNAIIFDAMMELYAKGDPIDVLSVISRLKEKKELKNIGGKQSVTYLATVVPTAGNVMHYAKIVQNNSTRRRLISAASDIAELGFEESQDVENVMDEAEQKLFEVSQGHRVEHFTSLGSALEDAFVRIDKLHKGDGALRGVPTGFPSLDKKLAGWQKSDLIILAARPSVGKTTLALDFARHAALLGHKVGVFSLEMSKDQLVDRMLAAHAHVDLWRLRTGKLATGGADDDFIRLGDAISELSQATLYIDDNPSANIMGMRTMARRLQSEHGLDLLIIDYLQLMESSRYVDNRVQEVSAISRGLKKLAIELGIPVMALSQLSRAVEMRTDQRPKLSDLRESGCLGGETLITRADTGERVSMKSLADREKQTPIPVFALNEHYRQVIVPMTKVFHSGKKHLYELRTRSGRIIRASANHPFRTIERWERLDHLKAGSKIAMPRHLESQAKESPMKDEELILLAHLIGDGCTVPQQPIHYTSADPANLDIVEQTASTLFGITPRRVAQKNWWHTYLPTPYRLTHGKYHPITQWLKDMGLDLYHSYEKRVPQSVFGCTSAGIALFLHHVWATDGNISWKLLPGRKPAGAIYYSSSSKQLAQDVMHLLLQLGILSTLRKVTYKLSPRPGYQIWIQGREEQIKFLSLVGSYGKRGNDVEKMLFALRQIRPNPNTDTIPQEAWRGIITAEKEAAGMSWREVSRGIGMSYAGSALFKNGVGRERMARLAVALESTVLQEIATSDIVWDEVMSVTEQGMEDVYDATVPYVHNFVANDIFVHNSIEQDADIVMFLHRQPWEGEERPEVMEVDLLIEKHRNGPTGEIPLQFNTQSVSYTETEMIHMEEQLPAQVSA
jgi:replicative DNA helicase